MTGRREGKGLLPPSHHPRAPLDRALLVNIYRRLRDGWGRVRSGVVDADLLALPGSGEVIKHSSIARREKNYVRPRSMDQCHSLIIHSLRLVALINC